MTKRKQILILLQTKDEEEAWQESGSILAFLLSNATIANVLVTFKFSILLNKEERIDEGYTYCNI